MTFNKYHIRGSPFKVNIAEVKTKQEHNSEPEIEERQQLSSEKTAKQQTNYDIVTNWNNESTIRSNIDEIRDINNFIEMSGLNNRILTPITDTSEENSDDNIDERIVYRGETIIEDYQMMPDGSAHLLLHIDDTECMDLNNIKGKYKYKLKRIGGLDDFECPHRGKKMSKIEETEKFSPETKFDQTDKFRPESKFDQTEKFSPETKFDETIDSSPNPKSAVSATIQKFQDAAKANNIFVPANTGEIKKIPKTSSTTDEVLNNNTEITKSYQETITGPSNQKKEFLNNEQLSQQPIQSKSEQSLKKEQDFDTNELGQHKQDKHYEPNQTQDYGKKPIEDYDDQKSSQYYEQKPKKPKHEGETELFTNTVTRRKSSGSNEVERDVSSAKPSLIKKQTIADDDQKFERPHSEKRDSDLNINKGENESTSEVHSLNTTTTLKPFEPVAANVSEKRNFFENAAANVKNTPQINKLKTKGDETASSIPRQSSRDRAEAEKSKDKCLKSDSKTDKSLAKDFGKQKTDSFEKEEAKKRDVSKGGSSVTGDSINRSDSQKSKGSSKKSKENDKDQGKSGNDEDDQNDDDDDDDEEVINVFNEKIVTKHIRQLQKTVDEETTVVKDEKFVITPVDSKIDEVDSKSPVPDSTTNVIHQNEDIKSYIDRKTTIVNETSGKNKPTRIEILTQRLRTEPMNTNSQQMEHLVEKFKPEESITYLYEYDQVIENPESETNKGDRSITVVDQVTTKTTKKQNTEVSQTVEPIIPRHEKKITSSTTTYVTQEEKDKVTESLEKMVVDSNEYSYKQIKGTLEEDETVDIHEPNYNTLTEYLMSSNINEEPIESSTTVSVTTSATCGIGFKQEDLDDSGKSVAKTDLKFTESKISSKEPPKSITRNDIQKEHETSTPTVKPKVKDLSYSQEKAIDDEYEELTYTTKRNLDDIMKDIDDPYIKNKKFDEEFEDKPNKESGSRKKSDSIENKDRKKKMEDTEENEVKQRKKSDEKIPTIGKTVKIQKGVSSIDDEDKISSKVKKEEARKISDKKVNQVEDLTDARTRLRKTSTPKVEDKLGAESIGDAEIKSEDKIPLREVRPHTRSIDSIPESRTKDSTDDQTPVESSDVPSKPKIEKISKSKLGMFEPKKDDVKVDSEKTEKTEKVTDKPDKKDPRQLSQIGSTEKLDKKDSKKQLKGKEKEKDSRSDSLDDQTSERIKKFEKNTTDSSNIETPSVKSKSKVNPNKGEKISIDDNIEQIIQPSLKKRAEEEEVIDYKSLYPKDKTKKIEDLVEEKKPEDEKKERKDSIKKIKGLYPTDDHPVEDESIVNIPKKIDDKSSIGSEKPMTKVQKAKNLIESSDAKPLDLNKAKSALKKTSKYDDSSIKGSEFDKDTVGTKEDETFKEKLVKLRKNSATSDEGKRTRSDSSVENSALKTKLITDNYLSQVLGLDLICV